MQARKISLAVGLLLAGWMFTMGCSSSDGSNADEHLGREHEVELGGVHHAQGHENPFVAGCAECHGPDLRGDKGPSCYQCHNLDDKLK